MHALSSRLDIPAIRALNRAKKYPGIDDYEQ
jgi:hypothetical protein